MNDFLIEKLKRGDAIPVSELRAIFGHRPGAHGTPPVAAQIPVEVALWFDPFRQVLCYRRAL